MSTTKRTPVPKVVKPKAPPIPETTQVTEETHSTTPDERNTTMKPQSFFKKSITLISNNRETIKRKVIVGVGTGIGMLIASAVTDAINRRPEVVYVNNSESFTHVPSADEIAEKVVEKTVRATRTPRAKAVVVTPADDEVEGPNADD